MFLSAGHLAKWIHFRPALALAVLWAKFSKRFLQPAFGSIFRPLAEQDQAAPAMKYTKFNVPNVPNVQKKNSLTLVLIHLPSMTLKSIKSAEELKKR